MHMLVYFVLPIKKKHLKIISEIIFLTKGNYYIYFYFIY